jgi:hypothetical protein
MVQPENAPLSLHQLVHRFIYESGGRRWQAELAKAIAFAPCVRGSRHADESNLRPSVQSCMLETMTLPAYHDSVSPPVFSASQRRDDILCVCAQNLDEVVKECVRGGPR